MDDIEPMVDPLETQDGETSEPITCVETVDGDRSLDIEQHKVCMKKCSFRVVAIRKIFNYSTFSEFHIEMREFANVKIFNVV